VPRPEDGPRAIGDYTLLAPLGEGGMGVVHLARRFDGQRVALKVLRPHVVGDDETRARLAREVGSLRRVRSRWVAEIIDADPWAPVPYIATRYVPGLSLHDEVMREGPVRGDDLAWLARCLLEGIAAVHEAGVLHRDVKPSNVLMEGRTPVLIDFGLARVADDPKLTQTGWLLGTPGYLAPEVLYGEEPTPAVDVHAWAATVAYAATGRPPYGRGPSMAVMDRARRGEHDLTGVPSPLYEVLDTALSPEPERRPAVDDLLAWLRGQGPVPVARPPRPLPPVAPVPEPVETMPLSLFPGPGEPAAQEDDEDGDETRVDAAPWTGAPSTPARPGLGQRSRRAVLLAALGLAAAAGVAAYPWAALAALLVLVWLLRTGSLAAATVAERRQLRGAKWYDGPRLVLGAPWDLIRSLPTTVLLGIWACGLAVAAVLVCYAVAAPITTTLAAAGVVLVGGLWWGPGGGRLRSPVDRVARPLSRGVRGWLLALCVVAGIGGLLGGLAAGGPDWLPASGAPFSGLAP
jgi:predicted Ser/Thr protein kinase